MKQLTSLILILATVLAACGTPAPDGFDWCYEYRFHESNMGVNIQDGMWFIGEGIRSDPTGLLRMNWVHGQLVTPDQLIVTAVRPPGVTGDITVTANAIAFGVAIAFTETMPAALSEVVIAVQPQTAGENGTAVNVSIDASQPISIKQFEARGRFVNPFPINYCGRETPSPTPSQTSQFTNTPAPTGTPTPTLTVTPGPSPTPQEYEICYDFSESQHGFSALPVNESSPNTASYIAGTGWRYLSANYTANARLIWLASPTYSGFTLTGWRANFIAQDTTSNVLGGATRNGGAVLGDLNVPYTAGTMTYTTTGSTGVTSLSFKFNSPTPNNPNNRFLETFWITQICIKGRNLPVTPTPTSSPTATTTVTRTPLGTVAAGTPRPTRTPIRIGTATLTRTPTPSTPPATVPTGTPAPTRTNIPAPTTFMTATINPNATPSPNPNPDGENEAEWNILDAINAFFNWVFNTVANFWDWLGQIFNWLNGTFQNLLITIGNFFNGIGDFFNSVIALIVELFDIARLIVDIIGGLVRLALAWIGNAIARVATIITAFFTVQPIPIPTLPQCATAPTQHDVCALWYIFDFTFLAQGTPGQYIIPLLTIVLNLTIILFFVRFVQKFIRRGESITHVG